MSTHRITLESPRLGLTTVLVGYDAMIGEAYMTYERPDCEYMSPGGIEVKDLQQLAEKQLGMRLPEPVIDAIQVDVADFRMGAKDINRRVYAYETNGTLIDALTM